MVCDCTRQFYGCTQYQAFPPAHFSFSEWAEGVNILMTRLEAWAIHAGDPKGGVLDAGAWGVH